MAGYLSMVKSRVTQLVAVLAIVSHRNVPYRHGVQAIEAFMCTPRAGRPPQEAIANGVALHHTPKSYAKRDPDPGYTTLVVVFRSTATPALATDVVAAAAVPRCRRRRIASPTISARNCSRSSSAPTDLSNSAAISVRRIARARCASSSSVAAGYAPWSAATMMSSAVAMPASSPPRTPWRRSRGPRGSPAARTRPQARRTRRTPASGRSECSTSSRFVGSSGTAQRPRYPRRRAS